MAGGFLDKKSFKSRIPYQGITSFWRADYSQDLTTADFAVYGIPCDASIVNRPGTRYGPRAIREQSCYVAIPGVHWPFDYDFMQKHRLIDWGDIGFYPGQVGEMLANAEEEITRMSEAGVGTLGLGGDHIVAYPAIKAHAKRHGPLALIHFDAHTDTHPSEVLNHGSMFWFADKEGLIDAKSSVQIGIRTLIPEGQDYTVIDAHKCIDMGSKAIIAKIREVVGDRPCYISLDVDGMDPAHAPGTGTPLPGGITSAMQREIIWGLSGLNIVGGDVVEVSPPYDPSHITAILGATLGMDILYVMAESPMYKKSQKRVTPAMARLLSIHAGKTKTYSADNITFETAIRKQELRGPVTLTSQGVEGNEVANHKNAVFAYCLENYAYWNDTLKPAQPWAPGSVGENLTLAGIDESQVRVGDLFKIGSVTLQVSGCREPCANFLWHMQLPTSFLSTYQASGRTGMYLEVLQPGVIQAGDAVEHISCRIESITVPELARFFMNPQPDPLELDRLISIPGMGLQMLSAMMAARNTVTEKKLVRSNRWSGWKKFVVHRIVQETQHIKSFYLQPADGAPVAGYRAGQFLTVQVPLDDGETVTRCWSISGYDESLQGYRISIKKEAQGQASSWMHERLAEGDMLNVLPPNGRFTLQRGAIAQPVVLISGGVGITPMVSMLHAHVARADKRLPSLYFIHATQGVETHAFKDEVEAVVAQYPHFQGHTIYSSAPASPASSNRLDKSELTRILSNVGSWFSEKWVTMRAEHCAYYLCGPPGFMDAIRSALVSMGVPDASIAQESFAGGLGSLEHLQIASAQVQFARSALTADWRQEDDMSLLELAEQQGLRPAFSCRNGQCGLCRTTVLSGEVMYLTEPDADVPPGDVLLCCALPKGDLVLDL